MTLSSLFESDFFQGAFDLLEKSIIRKTIISIQITTKNKNNFFRSTHMNIKGKLVEIFDTVQITDTFKKREFIIEDSKNPEYPEFIKVELIQDKVDLLDSLSVGDQINVLINIKGRKWQDKEGNIKYFNSIQGWKN